MSRCRQSFLLIGIVGAWLFHMNMQQSWSRDNVEVICERQSPSAPICAYNGNGRHPRILILGAGMSGISAAQALIDLGYTDLMILEGSDRIGGRLRDVKLGDYTIETGAQFIHGKGDNPIYSMAMKHKLNMAESSWSNVIMRDNSGVIVTDYAMKNMRVIHDYYTNISLFKERDDSVSSIKDALSFLNNEAQSDIERAVEYFMFDYELGATPEEACFYHFSPSATYTQHNTPVRTDMSVNDNKGYSSIISQMLNNLNVSVRLNHVVTQVTQKGDDVIVNTSTQGQFHADYVIMTFSLGVLQSDSVKFRPPLPRWKLKSIHNFQMTQYVTIFLRFQFSFWDSNEYILYSGSRRGYFTVWRNLNKYHPGSHIIQAVLTGDDVKRVSTFEDSKVVEEALAVLKQMYPSCDVPTPIGHFIPRWFTDPLQRGSFSNWPSGYRESDFRRLTRPVGRIHFAGEHTDPVHFGYLQGAYYSGYRAAQEIVKKIASFL